MQVTAEELSVKGILEIFILRYAVILNMFFFFTADDMGFIDPIKDLLTPEREIEKQIHVVSCRLKLEC